MVLLVKIMDTPDYTYTVIRVFVRRVTSSPTLPNAGSISETISWPSLFSSKFLMPRRILPFHWKLPWDLNPENILVAGNGMNVKLADFGLAKMGFTMIVD